LPSRLDQVSLALFKRLSEREDSEIEGLNDAYRSALEQTIERVVGQLPRDAGGRLEPDPAALARLRREFGRFGDAQGASLLLEQHVERVSAALTRQVDVLSDGWQRLGEDPLESDQLALSTLVKANFLDGFTELGRYHHNALRDAVMRQALGRATGRDLRAELQRITGKAESEVDRQHHDAVIGYSRAVIQESAEQRGYEYYQYIGPDDSANRPFCDRHVDKIYTREEIDALDNGQIANVFLTGGGYRCRHHWRPVRPEWLRESDLDREGKSGGTGGDPSQVYEPGFVDELDVIAQEEPYSCGAAVAQQILKDLGIDVPQSELYKAASKKRTLKDGTGRVVSEMIATDISSEILKRASVTIRLDGMLALPPLKNQLKSFRGLFSHVAVLTGTHWVIWDDVDDDFVYIRDPWGKKGPPDNQTKGGLRAKLKIDEFMIAMSNSNWTMVIVK
jgi:hypothetical protein